MIRKLLVISVLWAILILIISGMPGDSIPQSKFWKIPHFDKIVHMALYFPLGFFLMAEFSLSSVRWIQKLSVWMALLIVALYGGLIEVGQDYLFVNRSADWWDFFADILGGLLGILIFKWLFLRLFRRFQKPNPSSV